MTEARTAKRGEKAKPSKPPMKAHKYTEREVSATKKGPGRRPLTSGHGDYAARTAVAPAPLKKLHANVGRNSDVRIAATRQLDSWYPGERRVWRHGEPMHIVKPVRAARIAAIKAKQEGAK